MLNKRMNVKTGKTECVLDIFNGCAKKSKIYVVEKNEKKTNFPLVVD